MPRITLRRHPETMNPPLAEPKSSEKSNIFSIAEKFQKSWNSTPNITKLALYGIAGYLAVQGMFSNKNEGFINDVIYVPIIEELFFRGIVYEGIKGVQSLYNYFVIKKELTDTQIKTQEQFRVHLTSGIFAYNHERILEQKILLYYHLGRASGYLKEKTGSLFASIVLHMAHNLQGYFQERASFPLILLTSSHLLYIPVLTALNKKFIPVPDFLIPNFITRTTAKIRNFFYDRFIAKSQAIDNQ